MGELIRYVSTWGGRPMNLLDLFILIAGMVVGIVFLDLLVALIESIKGLL